MVLGREEEYNYEIQVDGVQLEKISEFRYLRCVLDESGTDVAEYQKVKKERKAAGAIRF